MGYQPLVEMHKRPMDVGPIEMHAVDLVFRGGGAVVL